MRNVFHIISKNLKLLIRSRSSALIIILAPLLIILLLGVAFDNANVFGLTIGVYSESFAESTESFLAQLTEQELEVIKYETEEVCIDDIKIGSVNTCIVLPPNFDIESNEQKKITFHVDYSKINLVWTIMDTLNVRFESSSSEISQDLITVLVNKLSASQIELEDKKKLIEQLRTDTINAQGNVGGITQDLDAFSFEFNNDTFPIQAVEEELRSIEANLSIILESAKKNVSEVKDLVNTTNIVARLDGAMERLDIAQEIVEEDYNPSIKHLKSDIEGMKSSIEELKIELSQARDFRGDTVPLLTTIKDRLGTSVDDLNQLEEIIDAVIGDIKSIKVTNPEAIAQPLVTEIKPVSAPSTYLNYLFPSLIILVIMFISMLLSTTLVMMEKHSPAYFRNFITPTRNISFLVGTYLTNMFLVAIQAGIIVIIAGYFFSAQVFSNIPMIIAILLLAATFFTLLGMVVGYIFTSEETATLATVSAGSIFLFLSSVIIPIESMPEVVRKIAYYNPFVICERLLREAILFKPELPVLQEDLLLIAGYSVAVFVLIIAFQGIMSKHFLKRITYYHHKKKRKEMKQREMEHLHKKAAKKFEKEEKQDKEKKEVRREKPQRNSVKSLSWGLSIVPKNKRQEREEKVERVEEKEDDEDNGKKGREVRRKRKEKTQGKKKKKSRQRHLSKQLERINEELESMYGRR